jgi:hypothetical protein
MKAKRKIEQPRKLSAKAKPQRRRKSEVSPPELPETKGGVQEPQAPNNQYAIGAWQNPVVDPTAAQPPLDFTTMSADQLERMIPTPPEADRERGMMALTHPINSSPAELLQEAERLKAQARGKNRGQDVVEFFPRAYQKLCEATKFFASDPQELAFVETHGRRFGVGEGLDRSKIPQRPEVRFDPANLAASCETLRKALGSDLTYPKRPATLAKYVTECHQAIWRERERCKTVLRDRGAPDACGTASQNYEEFARDGLVFIGEGVRFLATYINFRSKGSSAPNAARLVLGRQRAYLSKVAAQKARRERER